MTLALAQELLPPQNLDAERSVLGAILLNNEALHRVLELHLEPRDFFRENHQKIFEILISLSERGQPLDMLTVQNALKDRGWFEAVGGTATMTGLFEDVYSIANVTHYARIVRD